LSSRTSSARERRKALLWIGTVYLAAAVVALVAGWIASRWRATAHPLAVAAIADLTATWVVFGFSYALDNSSIYDPYWSIAPLFLAGYWSLAAPPGGVDPLRRTVLLALVGLWAGRLTWSCLRRWRGLSDEDWRYRERRSRHESAYWWVSLGGIHLMPTLLVYLGCLPLYVTLTASQRPMGILDGAALVLTLGAIWVEARADRELWRHRSSDERSGERLETGLWRIARHPNYVGEMAFWWGLYLFGLAAAPRYWWTIVGPLSITGLFVFISIPLMERHMEERDS
jgi:steroid 5-alpha reductase family enzyme